MRLQIGENFKKYIYNNVDDGYTFKQQLSSLIVPDTAKLNYIEIIVENEKLKISYLPDSRKADNPFESAQRQTAKPITVLKKLLPTAELSSLNYWVDKLKLFYITSTYDIKEAIGSEMFDMYHVDNYVPGAGASTLGQSCMRYDKCQPYIEFYVKNKNVVRGVWLDIDGLVAARALIWNVVHNKKFVSVLDRVYAQSNVLEENIKTWASTNCDYILDHTTKIFTNNNNGKHEYLDVYVPLQYVEPPYPYLDNFRFLFGKRLYNTETRKISGVVLQATTGEFSERVKALPGYKPGYVYTASRNVWVDKNTVCLVRTTYEDKYNCVECSVCNITMFKNQCLKTKLENETIYICKTHRFPLVFNNILYKLCGLHEILYENDKQECDVCATIPKTCSFCLRSTLGCTRVNTFYFACHTCKELTPCSTCSVLKLKYELLKGLTTSYCRDCYNNWESCDTCAIPLEPGTTCNCTEYIIPCNRCDDNLHVDDAYIVNNNQYCPSCFEDYSYYCDYCMRTHIQLPDGPPRPSLLGICVECYSDRVFTCTMCTNPSIHISSYEEVCEPCADANEYLCSECECWTLATSTVEGVCTECV